MHTARGVVSGDEAGVRGEIRDHGLDDVRMSCGEALTRIEAEKDASHLISGGAALSIASVPLMKRVCWNSIIHRLIVT